MMNRVRGECSGNKLPNAVPTLSGERDVKSSKVETSEKVVSVP